MWLFCLFCVCCVCCRVTPALLLPQLSDPSHALASLSVSLLSLSIFSLCARAPGERSMAAFLHRPLWSGRLPGGSGGSAVAVGCVLCRGDGAPLRTAQTPFQSCAPRWAGRSGTELSAPPESEDGVGGLRQRRRRRRGQVEVRKLRGKGVLPITHLYTISNLDVKKRKKCEHLITQAFLQHLGLYL